MKKQSMLKIVNVILFIAFITTIISIFIYDIIPSSLNGNEVLGEIHETAGMIFAIFAFVHIGFNWKWIKTQIFKKKGEKK